MIENLQQKHSTALDAERLKVKDAETEMLKANNLKLKLEIEIRDQREDTQKRITEM